MKAMMDGLGRQRMVKTWGGRNVNRLHAQRHQLIDFGDHLGAATKVLHRLISQRLGIIGNGVAGPD